MPNFVDCEVFRPAADVAGKQALRQALGVPSDTLVVGCVAAVKKHHKRIDYLIREFHQWAVDSRQSTEALNPRVNRPPYTVHRPQHSGYLLIAGAKTGETDELITLAESLIPGRYKILTDLGRDRMPDLYRAMDVFVLTSLFEMMPIALLEALASGLPAITNDHPVLTWMTGAVGSGQWAVDSGQSHRQPSTVYRQPSPVPRLLSTGVGGTAIDMSEDGALTHALAELTPEWIAEHGRQARERALQMFSREVVISQYVDYYRQVLADGE